MRTIDKILATGDGSEARPYHVWSISEEKAVLSHFGKCLESQSLIEKDGRNFDVITCGVGVEYWFDISQLGYFGMRANADRCTENAGVRPYKSESLTHFLRSAPAILVQLGCLPILLCAIVDHCWLLTSQAGLHQVVLSSILYLGVLCWAWFYYRDLDYASMPIFIQIPSHPTPRYLERKRERRAMSCILLILAGALLVFGYFGFAPRGFPLAYGGVALTVVSIYNLLGFNGWISGPLDPMHDQLYLTEPTTALSDEQNDASKPDLHGFPDR